MEDYCSTTEAIETQFFSASNEISVKRVDLYANFPDFLQKLIFFTI